MDNEYTGYLEVQSWGEVVERGAGGDSGFFVRTDGLSRLKISFKMCDDDSEDPPICKPQSHWNRNYDLIVTHVEDTYDPGQSEANDSFTKYRRFHFEDERYHRLKMVNIEWSTSQYHAKKKGEEEVFEAKYGQPDEYHTMIASDAIRSVLKTVGSSKQDPESPDVKIGCKMFQDPDSASFLFGQIDKEKWFKTDDKLSLVKFINPVNSNALNAISYLMSHAVDKYGYPCILSYGSTDKEREKGWKLETLFKIFNENKDKLAEKFYITDSSYPQQSDPTYDPSGPSEERSAGQTTEDPQEGDDVLKFFHDTNASHIKQYAYSGQGANNVDMLTNRPLCNYDFQSHSLKFYQKYADVKSNYKATSYEGKKLYSAKGDGCPLPISNNYVNMKGHSVLYSTTPRVFFPDSMSRNMYIWDAITNASKITFEVPGAVFRRPRLWFSINRFSNTSRNNWLDYRMQGEWLCTKVVHVFADNDYRTVVEGTRFDIWKDPPKSKPDEAQSVGL